MVLPSSLLFADMAALGLPMARAAIAALTITAIFLESLEAELELLLLIIRPVFKVKWV